MVSSDSLKDLKRYREGQNYFILRRGDPWKVFTIDGKRKVADYPAYRYDTELIDKVCHARDDDEVKGLLAERVES